MADGRVGAGTRGWARGTTACRAELPDREEQELGKEAEKEKRETGAVKTFLPGPLQAEVDRLASPLPAPCVAPTTCLPMP